MRGGVGRKRERESYKGAGGARALHSERERKHVFMKGGQRDENMFVCMLPKKNDFPEPNQTTSTGAAPRVGPRQNSTTGVIVEAHQNMKDPELTGLVKNSH